jgi:transposase-like protein
VGVDPVSKSASERQTAETMFVRQGKTLAEIAGLIGVSKTTLANWSRDGEWVRKREERLRDNPLAGLDILKARRNAIYEKMGNDPKADDASLEDRLSKIDVHIRNAEDPNSLGTHLSVLEAFTDFVMTQWPAGTEHPEKGVAVREAVEAYLEAMKREHMG